MDGSLDRERVASEAMLLRVQSMSGYWVRRGLGYRAGLPELSDLDLFP